VWPVSWAAEDVSENWMDVGREYTERWHHQMQIRDAIKAPPTLLEPEWFRPLLELSVRALVKSYENVVAPNDTKVTFAVTTAQFVAPNRAGKDDEIGAWTLVREGKRWILYEGAGENADTVVRASADAAWRLLYNAPRNRMLPSAISVEGDKWLSEPLMKARAIIL
jgi:hypothetical protein